MVLIRKGGQETPEGFLFELSGGSLALDFANTVDNRPTEERIELLSDYGRLLSWTRQVGLITPEEEAALAEKAVARRSEADDGLHRAIRLRELLFNAFSSVADGHQLSASTVRRLNKLFRRTFDKHGLVQTTEALQWKPLGDRDAFDWMLWPIAYSALNLLTSSNIHRIRRCAAERCDWLFLDVSKRGNRRWCDMTVCGNRAKARRHYQRIKAAIT